MFMIFIFILISNNSSCLTIIMMNYWKPYGNMRREKGVDIIDNRKQHEAQISYEINIRNTYPIDCP
jgi:hypothetical protein